jgi:hypothetical protein
LTIENSVKKAEALAKQKKKQLERANLINHPLSTLTHPSQNPHFQQHDSIMEENKSSSSNSLNNNENKGKN